MMKLSAAVLSGLVIVSAALAQAPSTPPQSPEAPKVQGPATERQITPEERTRLRAARESCRTEIRSRDLPRGERRRAIRSCIATKNPDLAPIFARGEQRRAEMRQMRDTCREDIRGRRLNGDERRQAMQSCMVSKRPELAKVFSCRDEAVKRSLNPGPERRDFMRTCIRG